jgi:hypothetical protein
MDNKRALSGIPKLWIVLYCTVVGEHSVISEATGVSRGGEDRKANVGISNDKAGEKPAHRKTKVS